MSDKRNLKQRAKDAKGAWNAGKSRLSATVTEDAKRKLKDLIIIIVTTVLLLGVYYYFVQTWQFQTIFIIYLVIWAAAFIAYWVYNRGFSRKGVTPEMLPDEWSAEKKTQFIEDGKRRMEKSRWLIYIIAPLCFVFIAEIFMTLVWPTIYQFLTKMGG